MRGRGFSLWAMPTGNVYAELSEVIGQLSHRFESPSFEPHVTLLSGLDGPTKELTHKAATLAATIAPFKISLQRFGYLEKYFRCFFIHADRTNALLEVHQRASLLLGRSPDRGFLPHLSLVYGSLSAIEKEVLASDLRLPMSIEFVVDALDLFSTEGEPRQWRRIGHFPIGRAVEAE